VPWNETTSLGAAVLLSLVALGGLLARRKVHVCRLFVLFLGAVALADLLQLVWPERFYRQWFWFGSQLVIDVLRFALALELTYRTFRAFPSARATARGVLLVVLLITLAVVFAGTGNLEPPEGAPDLGPLISRVQPRVLNGAIWLLTAIAALILWYRLPVHPLHKAILIGLVPYLLVFTVSLNVIESQGWAVRESVNLALGPAYLLLLTYWAVAAWRRAEAPVQAPSHERRLEQAAG
jgi:hypothetical protein